MFPMKSCPSAATSGKSFLRLSALGKQPYTLASRAALIFLFGMAAANAQTGFATSEITNPIRNLVTIANATIAGLAILAVIYYAIRWIGGDEGAAKKIIGVILVAVIALGAANFLGFLTGKAEFDTFTG